MSDLPSVCAIMLATPGREAMRKQAQRAFEAQTYSNASILTVASGHRSTVGELRNYANALTKAEIIVHWDDDDWSHPNRIGEQVTLLRASGADCVGYNEMLFWRGVEPGAVCSCGCHHDPTHAWAASECTRCDKSGMQITGEAWLYRNENPAYALGTSLCYWRRAWQAIPFPAIDHGEDTEWLSRVFPEGHRMHVFGCGSGGYPDLPDEYEPRMIARIHAGNHSNAYDPIEMARHNALPRSERQWSRVPAWDDYCRRVMES